jgi:hypothetical protein
MKFVIYLGVLLAFLILGSLYIGEEDNTLEAELSQIHHPDLKTINHFHEKFAHLDMDAQNFDLNKTIHEVEEARKLYPLDDKLKMIDMELNYRRAQKAYEPTKDTTPDN